MIMFTNCSGSCITCACSNGCLAGHGDDDYIVKSKEDLLKTIKDLTIELKIERKLIDKDDDIIKSLEKKISICKLELDKTYNYNYK